MTMLTLTAVRQLAILPAMPVHWRATHGDAVPHFEQPGVVDRQPEATTTHPKATKHY